jgi:mRNA-degrading endonuclease RelE of RelBE toxin-antitoxin system
MRFDIVLAPEAVEDLKRLKPNVRTAVRIALETRLRHEKQKTSRCRIKRLRSVRRPQFRLRIGEVRVFYDVTGSVVGILAIVAKSEAESRQAQFGNPERGKFHCPRSRTTSRVSCAGSRGRARACARDAAFASKTRKRTDGVALVIGGRIRRALFALALLALAGCAHHGRPGDGACVLASQKPMVVVELFFGRDVPGREPVSDAEWAEFRSRVIAAQFPDGFTVFDADGQGRTPRPAGTVRERTKVLRVAVDRGADVAAKVGAVTEAYRTQFRQAGVGILTSRACGAF